MNNIEEDFRGTEVFSSTIVSVIEVHPHAHKYSSERGTYDPSFGSILDRLERERIEDILNYHRGGCLAVYQSPYDSNAVRIELNSATSFNPKFRVTALDLYPDGRLIEIHRHQHNNEKQYQMKNQEIQSRLLYYIVKTGD